MNLNLNKTLNINGDFSRFSSSFKTSSSNQRGGYYDGGHASKNNQGSAAKYGIGIGIGGGGVLRNTFTNSNNSNQHEQQYSVTGNNTYNKRIETKNKKQSFHLVNSLYNDENEIDPMQLPEEERNSFCFAINSDDDDDQMSYRLVSSQNAATAAAADAAASEMNYSNNPKMNDAGLVWSMIFNHFVERVNLENFTCFNKIKKPLLRSVSTIDSMVNIVELERPPSSLRATSPSSISDSNSNNKLTSHENDQQVKNARKFKKLQLKSARSCNNLNISGSSSNSGVFSSTKKYHIICDLNNPAYRKKTVNFEDDSSINNKNLKNKSDCIYSNEFDNCHENLTTYNGITKCFFTCVQIQVTQTFKNMDLDLDNKLSYHEFKKGVSNLLFGNSTNDFSKTFFKTHSKVIKFKNLAHNQHNQAANHHHNNKLETVVYAALEEASTANHQTHHLPQSSSKTSSKSYNRLNSVNIKSEFSGIEDQTLEELFKRFDLNNDGFIDFSEFIKGVRVPMCQRRINVLNEAFDKLDVDKDKKITINDLKKWHSANLLAKKHHLFGGNHRSLTLSSANTNLALTKAASKTTHTSSTSQIIESDKRRKKEQELELSLWNWMGQFNLSLNPISPIDREKFIDHYMVLSSTIINDTYFDLFIRNIFNVYHDDDDKTL